ncbi:MAG TPA: hypothetical protein VD835_00930 [Pyrinomonadaceae bacterium]|nr:hypothetical protein [Pyrinomonadaceae bacterium]
MAGTIKGCKHCQKVDELVSGYESEDPESLLLSNLDFLTDGSPTGRAVMLGEPSAATDGSRRRSILFTSLVWLSVCVASVLATIYYYENQMSAYQTKVINECASQMENLARELTSR